jgi:hypothetical protein
MIQTNTRMVMSLVITRYFRIFNLSRRIHCILLLLLEVQHERRATLHEIVACIVRSVAESEFFLNEFLIHPHHGQHKGLKMLDHAGMFTLRRFAAKACLTRGLGRRQVGGVDWGRHVRGCHARKRMTNQWSREVGLGDTNTLHASVKRGRVMGPYDATHPTHSFSLHMSDLVIDPRCEPDQCAVLRYLKRVDDPTTRTRAHVNPKSTRLPDYVELVVTLPNKDITHEDMHSMCVRLGDAFGTLPATLECYSEGGFNIARLGSRFRGVLAQYLGHDDSSHGNSMDLFETDHQKVLIPASASRQGGICLRHMPYGDGPQTLFWTQAHLRRLISVLGKVGWEAKELYPRHKREREGEHAHANKRARLE